MYMKLQSTWSWKNARGWFIKVCHKWTQESTTGSLDLSMFGYYIHTYTYLWFAVMPPFWLGVDVTTCILLSCVFDCGVPLKPSTVSIPTIQWQILTNSKYNFMYDQYFLLSNLVNDFLNKKAIQGEKFHM